VSLPEEAGGQIAITVARPWSLELGTALLGPRRKRIVRRVLQSRTSCHDVRLPTTTE
jgi:hypothetical protein